MTLPLPETIGDVRAAGYPAPSTEVWKRLAAKRLAAIRRVHTHSEMEKLEDKLYTVRSKADTGHPHIHIDSPSVCVEKCAGKYCTQFCPAGVYNWDEAAARIVVSWENCIECGACSIGCPFDIIRCETPRGGFGVQNRYG